MTGRLFVTTAFDQAKLQTSTDDSNDQIRRRGQTWESLAVMDLEDIGVDGAKIGKGEA